MLQRAVVLRALYTGPGLPKRPWPSAGASGEELDNDDEEKMCRSSTHEDRSDKDDTMQPAQRQPEHPDRMPPAGETPPGRSAQAEH